MDKNEKKQIEKAISLLEKAQSAFFNVSENHRDWENDELSDRLQSINIDFDELISNLESIKNC